MMRVERDQKLIEQSPVEDYRDIVDGFVISLAQKFGEKVVVIHPKMPEGPPCRPIEGHQLLRVVRLRALPWHAPSTVGLFWQDMGSDPCGMSS